MGLKKNLKIVQNTGISHQTYYAKADRQSIITEGWLLLALAWNCSYPRLGVSTHGHRPSLYGYIRYFSYLA